MLRFERERRIGELKNWKRKRFINYYITILMYYCDIIVCDIVHYMYIVLKHSSLDSSLQLNIELYSCSIKQYIVLYICCI